jgi:hypothetical protein
VLQLYLFIALVKEMKLSKVVITIGTYFYSLSEFYTPFNLLGKKAFSEIGKKYGMHFNRQSGVLLHDEIA